MREEETQPKSPPVQTRTQILFSDSMRSLSFIKMQRLTRDSVTLQMTVTLSSPKPLLLLVQRSFTSFSLRAFLYLRHPVCLFQDPSGRDQGAAGCGEEDGERRAAGHHLGASAHGQADPVHAVQHAGQRGPGQVLITHTVRTRLFSFLFTDILLHEFRAAGERSERFPEVRIVLVDEATLLKGQTSTHNNSKPINYTCSAGGNQSGKLLHL